MDAEDWKRDCELANSYYSFLEDQLVNDVNAQVYPFQQLVTYERLNQILFCKQDCNFDRLLSVSSNFTANLTECALNALNHLSLAVSCRTSSIAKYIVPPQNAADIINNISEYFHKYVQILSGKS